MPRAPPPFGWAIPKAGRVFALIGLLNKGVVSAVPGLEEFESEDVELVLLLFDRKTWVRGIRDRDMESRTTQF